MLPEKDSKQQLAVYLNTLAFCLLRLENWYYYILNGGGVVTGWLQESYPGPVHYLANVEGNWDVTGHHLNWARLYPGKGII